MPRHRIFLTWLIYLLVVVLCGAWLWALDIPRLAASSDHSHLTLVLLGVYGLCELLAGRQAWRLSKEHGIAHEACLWLDQHRLGTVQACGDGAVVLGSPDTARHTVPASCTARHMAALRDVAEGPHPDQAILVDLLAERLDAPTTTVAFLAGRIVWVGILATILGVILAFWPLLGAGMAVDAVRAKLGSFFAGIAVAFIPTAASFVFKIALDLETRILDAGSAGIVALLARTGETKVLPALALGQGSTR